MTDKKQENDALDEALGLAADTFVDGFAAVIRATKNVIDRAEKLGERIEKRLEEMDKEDDLAKQEEGRQD